MTAAASQRADKSFSAMMQRALCVIRSVFSVVKLAARYHPPPKSQLRRWLFKSGDRSVKKSDSSRPPGAHRLTTLGSYKRPPTRFRARW